MRELQRGLWWWEAVHPEWTPEDAATEDCGPEVSSYAIDDGERLLLFDPTTPPSPVDDLAGNRETVVVLTCPWHERDRAVDKGAPPEQILERLRPLLELPVEFVLPTHGAPTDRAALERALSDHDP